MIAASDAEAMRTERPMRIVHVVPSLSDRYGGPAYVARRLVAELRGFGHSVHLHSMMWEPPDTTLSVPPAEVEPHADTTLHRVTGGTYLYSRGLWRSLNRSVRCADVVHIHGHFRHITNLTALLAIMHRVPYVVRPHGSWDPVLYHTRKNAFARSMFDRFVEFPILRRAAVVHCTSAREIEQMRSIVSDASTVLVTNGVDDHAAADPRRVVVWRQRLAGQHEVLVLYLGRVSAKKRVDRLIRAFALARDVDRRLGLAIVGPTDDATSLYADLVTLVAELGLTEAVTFQGMVRADDKRAVLESADIFALTSDGENFGVSLVEAMAAGVPAVVTPGVDIAEAMANDGVVLLAQPQPESVADQLVRLASEQEPEMGAKGRKYVGEHFAWTSVARSVEAVYISLCLGERAHREGDRS